MEPMVEIEKLLETMEKRRIRMHIGEDKIRWGYLPKGSYTIKEVHTLIVGHHDLQQEPIWKLV